MEEQCDTTMVEKKSTKFESLTNEIDRSQSLINTVFQTISNIDERLGENKESGDKCDEDRVEPTSIIEKNTIKARDINNDLIAIQNKLKDILELF